MNGWNEVGVVTRRLIKTIEDFEDVHSRIVLGALLVEVR